jgi:hypothetical protein
MKCSDTGGMRETALASLRRAAARTASSVSARQPYTNTALHACAERRAVRDAPAR